ncbi:SusC/RagA family TonB-linked outer membrane protein [Flavivirga spongiicola]|uniref:TonB-dependent receptor n=1 Tax=Flavivirga spongiicola TaxID=421621 RepID=A0ABU7XPA5_9FLAO|nr:TonB-dependent receptor [Flavivirga sp. MEBiC05379]MDO5977604.1 TonB-dependent receptor [Flavivirga sp. MEBiC05379]
MKKLMNKGLLILSLVLTFSVHAQEISVNGIITDATGQPLPGASVVVKGTNNGVSSNFDGKYSIKTNTSDTLIFSFIGYLTQEVLVSNNNTIDIVLQEDTSILDEVVIVGYGTQKRENLTAAVSSVNLDKVDAKPITNLGQALQGMSAGVTSIQSSSQPGSSGSSIRIRGLNTLGTTNNTPLIVIDGSVGGSLNDVAPGDVASISILKDASSTAMYGARAAAGVILITTKRGKSGKMTFKYDGYVGFDEATELPDVISDSATYMELLREWTNDPAFPSDALIAEFRNDGGANPLKYPNVDWFETIMGGQAALQFHNFSVSGGSEAARVAASVNVLDQDGLVANTGYKRIGFRLNTNFKLSDKLDGGMDLFGNNSLRKSPGGSIQNLIPNIHSTVPYTVPINNGLYGYDGWTGSGGHNPLAQVNSRYHERETNKFTGKIFGTYKFLPNLKLTASATVYNAQSNAIDLVKKLTLHHFEDDSEEIARTNNELEESNSRNRVITLNAILEYDTTIKEKHNISLLAGYSQEENLWNTSSASGKGLVDESIFVLDGPQDQTSFQIGGNKTFNNLRSYFGRLNYDFDGKYLLEASFRYDGSSKFVKDLRWGFFPSLSLGWNIHKTDFLSHVDFITSLKLRGSVGQVGNNTSLGNYSAISTLEFGNNYSFNNSIEPGIYLNELANPELIWETTTTYGIGIDFGLFNNKITGEFDIYKNRTDGILRRVQAPYFGGIPQSPFENLAIVDGKGYELSLNYRNSEHKIKYSAGLTLSHSENKIVSFNDGQFQEVSGNYINKVGHPINSIYTYEHEGIFRTQEQINNHATQPQTPQIGDLIYKDQLTVDTNGDGVFDEADGVIDSDDRVIKDPSAPKINFGLNTNVEYNGFDLNVLLVGALGSKDFVRTSPARPFIYPGRGITGKEWIHAYHETRNPDSNTNVPRLDEGSGNFRASDYWMHDFSFLRVRTLQFGYTIPENIANKLTLSKARLYVNGQNLFTFENVPHFDPESVGRVYPLTKTVTLGVQLTF